MRLRHLPVGVVAPQGRRGRGATVLGMVGGSCGRRATARESIAPGAVLRGAVSQRCAQHCCDGSRPWGAWLSGLRVVAMLR